MLMRHRALYSGTEDLYHFSLSTSLIGYFKTPRRKLIVHVFPYQIHPVRLYKTIMTYRRISEKIKGIYVRAGRLKN